MHVTLVHIQVNRNHVDEFIAASRVNAEASRREPGILRFDVLQRDNSETEFVLVEAYRTAADAAAHKQTAHYRVWRDTVAPWMAEPRQGVVYRGIPPILAEK